MVNHMRTLWVNATAAQQAPFTNAYVTPDFAPVTLTPALAAVDRLLFPSDLSARVAVAEDLCFICAAGELAPYLYKFDGRAEYTRPAASLTDIVTAPVGLGVTEALARIIADPRLAATGKTLFMSTTHQADMDALFQVWTHPCEGVLRLCALALAFGYNVHALNSGRV